MAFGNWMRRLGSPTQSPRTASRRRSKAAGARTRLWVELLEDRINPSQILWSNEFIGDNNFAPVFGLDTALAERVVDAAIGEWEDVIDNFNQPGGGNTLIVSISMNSNPAVQGASTKIDQTFPDGKPKKATITLADTPFGPGSSWYLGPEVSPIDLFDPMFRDESVNAFTSYDTGAEGNVFDLLDTITHELGHAVGFGSTPQFTQFTHDTGLIDTIDPGIGKPPAGDYYTFIGPTGFSGLLTSYDAGNGGTDKHVGVHFAPPKASYTLPSGQVLTGADDLMTPYSNNAINPVTGFYMGERSIISRADAYMLGDAFGYTVNDPAQVLGTFYAVLDRASQTLIVSGRQDVPSSDNITIDTSDGYINVSVDLGTPPPGTDYTGPYTSSFPVGSVKSIIIETDGQGTFPVSYVNILRTPAGVSTSVETHGNDALFLGANGSVQGILGPVALNPGTKPADLYVDDSADGSDHPDITLADFDDGFSGIINGLAPAPIAYAYSGTFGVTLDTGTGSNTITVKATGGHLLTLNGHSINTTVDVGDDGHLNNIRAYIVVNNPTSVTDLVVDDSNDSGSHTSTIQTIGLINYGDITGLAGSDIEFAYSETHSVTVMTGTGENTVDVEDVGKPTTLISNSGATVNVGESGTLSGIQDRLTFEGSASTELDLDDSADGSAHTIAFDTNQFDGLSLPNANAITGLTPPSGRIYYQTGIGKLIVRGGGGTDIYNVEGTPSGTQVTIDTGAGNNHVNVTPDSKRLKDLGSDLFINAPVVSLGTTVTVDNTNGASPQGPTSPPPNDNYVIDPNSTTFGDPVTVNYRNVVAVTLFGGSTGNYEVDGTPSGATYTINPGIGPNTFNVAPGVQGLVINGLSTGPLIIDDSADTSSATYTVTASTFQINGSSPITYTGAQSLTVKGGSGSDTFNVEGTVAATPVTLDTGRGINLVSVAPTDEDLADIQGGLTIQGGGQTVEGGARTTAVLDDQNDIFPILFGFPNTYTVTSSTVDSSVSATIRFSGLIGLTLNGDRSDDSYNVESTAAGTPVTINTGQGNNVVNVSPSDLDLADIQGPLNIHGGGPTTAVLDDQNDIVPILFDFPNIYTVTGSTVDSFYSATIGYSGLIGLTLNGDRSDDFYDVESTTTGTPVTINIGKGSNTVNVTPTSEALGNMRSSLVIQEPLGGQASVNIDDQANTSAATYTLNATSVQSNVSSPITYAGAESLTVNGGGGGNTFDVQGIGAGTAVTLDTGAGDDAVNVGDALQTYDEMAGPLTVDGQSGKNTLTFNDQGQTQGIPTHSANDVWSADQVALYWVGTGDASGSTTVTFNNIQQTVLNDVSGPTTAEHTIDEPSLNTHLTINGHPTDDLIVSVITSGQALTDTVTGHFAGTIGDNVTFSGVYFVTTSGRGSVTYKYDPGGFMSAYVVDGGTGTLDLSDLSPGVSVDLDPTPNEYLGSTSHVPGVIVGFGGISNIIGTGGSDTLIGADGVTNSWSLTGADSGNVDGFTFSNFENLRGGSGADTFGFANGGTESGSIDGGGGVNTLDYSAYTGDVTVDLPLGTASLVGGGVKNIRNVVGSSGNDILVGDGTGNTLVGGTGRSLLIAGGGPGTLLGGPDEDILVGGSTNYDTIPAALTAIMAEWDRTDLQGPGDPTGYQARVGHLLNGGGLNGPSLLNGSSFHGNGGGNSLTGAAGLDLFFGRTALDSNDWNPGQGELFVDANAPTSRVSALPAFSPASFTVRWSGTDEAGPGIISYSEYVSDDGGAFTPWLINTAQTSATYTGVDGHTYGFYSVATDAAGTQQPAQASAQASTTVDATPPTSHVLALPALSPAVFTLNWTGSDGTGSGIASYSIYVADNGGAFTILLSNTTQSSAPFLGQPGHTYGFYSVATDDVGNVQTTPTQAQATTRIASALIGASTTIVGDNGQAFTGIAAGFIDPNGAHASSDYSATIDWGDGSGVDTNVSINPGSAANAFNVSGAHTYNTAGVFPVTILVTSGTGPGVAIHSTANVLTTVRGVQINDGSAQRSMVQSLTVTFGGVVTLGSKPFVLTNHTTNTSVNLVVSSQVVGGATVATLSFTGADIIGKSLADGRYTLTIVGSQITGPGGLQLDGAAAGAAGSDHLANFTRLFGDANGDGKVDNSDLLVFQSTQGKHAGDSGYLGYMDFNGDGAVDLATDYIQFRKRYGHSI